MKPEQIEAERKAFETWIMDINGGYLAVCPEIGRKAQLWRYGGIKPSYQYSDIESAWAGWLARAAETLKEGEKK